MKKFIPTYHALNLYEVDPAFFKAIGINTLILDLDNTLASYKVLVASDTTKAYIQQLFATGLKLVIVSNNKGPRVQSYAESLSLPFISGAKKPFTKHIKAYLAKIGADLSSTMMVGDQLLTDVFCANSLKVKILLTEKLVKEDQWTTRFNRLIDKPLRRCLRKKNKLKEWNYGRRTEES